MKTVSRVLVLIVVFVASIRSAAAATEEAVKVLSTSRYVFYFKVEKELVGGTVEIWTEQNELVQSEKIVRPRTLLDFFYLKPGTYIVKIKKDDKEYTFEYYNVE
jgi:hypothetical protein